MNRAHLIMSENSTLTGHCKAKDRRAVHKYCTLVSKFVFHRRMDSSETTCLLGMKKIARFLTIREITNKERWQVR